MGAVIGICIGAVGGGIACAVTVKCGWDENKMKQNPILK